MVKERKLGRSYVPPVTFVEPYGLGEPVAFLGLWGGSDGFTDPFGGGSWWGGGSSSVDTGRANAKKVNSSVGDVFDDFLDDDIWGNREFWWGYVDF